MPTSEELKQISLNWKKTTKKLFEEAWNDKEAFSNVVIENVGRQAHVLRTLRKETREAFCTAIFENREKIKDGSFSLFSLDGMFENNMPSYISKICHIINPHAYPLIWDTHVMKELGINYNMNKWNEEVSKRKADVAFLSDEEIFKKESGIWAFED